MKGIREINYIVFTTRRCHPNVTCYEWDGITADERLEQLRYIIGDTQITGFITVKAE